MRLRFASSALVFLVAMTMATGAFAQGIFTLSNGTVARGRSNGYAEAAGGITLFKTNGSLSSTTTPSTAGTVVIDYGVPIANDIGAADNMIAVTVCGASVDVFDGNEADTENRASLSTDSETLTIHVMNCGIDDTQPINIDGVLLSLVGSGATSIEAGISATGGVRLSGGGNARLTVIGSVVDPLTDDNVKAGQKLTLIRHTGEFASSAPGKNQFHLVITEAHNDSFADGQLELTFSGIPEDVEVEGLDAWVTTKKNFDRDEGDVNRVDPDDPMNEISIRPATADKDGEATVYLQMTEGLPFTRENDTDTAVDESQDMIAGRLTSGVDVIIVRGTVTGTKDDDLLPIDLDIQASVDLGPTGDDDDFNPENGLPVFDSDPTTPITVIESTPSRSTLKVPFVLTDGSFDTGIAVSNMSSGGSAQPGAITFDFYVGGMKMSHTTSASSPGSGLTESGMLMPGSTYAALLSQLFPGNPGGGYMIITTDFTSGDGNIFISDFAGFSATGSVRPNQ